MAPITTKDERQAGQQEAQGQGSGVAAAAARLAEAAVSGRPCAPVRDLLAGGSVEDAYAVQEINTRRELDGGQRLLGWKIGLTSPAVQRQLGVDQPDFGALLADGGFGDDEPIPLRTLMQPKLEAEVGFVLDHDLDQGPVTAIDVLRATAFVLPVFEVADSRVAGWDITIVDTVADNASAGAFVMGSKPTRLTDVDLREVEMRVMHQGAVVSEGSGAACLGHPVNAVVWLANTLLTVGRSLRAGDLVLSGALGPMVSVSGAGQYEAVLGGLGSVRATFTGELG
jgi:2-keto-4-pentenoate hydratase